MQRTLLVAMVLLVLIVLAVLLWPRGQRDAPDIGAAISPDAGATATAETGRSVQGGSAAGTVVARPSPSSPQRMDAETRARLLAEIGRRLAAPTAEAATGSSAAVGQGAPAPGAASAPAGRLSREYIQAQVREIVPLIKECYEQALEQQPELSARVTVRFTIEGDPELGGVISSSEIVGADGGVRPGSLDECVRETMYALKLQAPEGGGQVTVNYPFIFRTAPEP